MEGETKITTVEKFKDPRRVAQGKRLAAISREAKARKAKERQEQQDQGESEISSYLLLVPVIVIGAAAFGGYRYWKKEEPVKEEPKREENSINRESRLERL